MLNLGFASKRIFDHSLYSMFLEDDDSQDIAISMSDGVQHVLEQTIGKA